MTELAFTPQRIGPVEAVVAHDSTTVETSLGRFDSVLVAVGHRSWDPLSQVLEAAGLPVTVIGDAARPGQILDATRAGASILAAATPVATA